MPRIWFPVSGFVFNRQRFDLPRFVMRLLIPNPKLETRNPELFECLDSHFNCRYERRD